MVAVILAVGVLAVVVIRVLAAAAAVVGRVAVMKAVAGMGTVVLELRSWTMGDDPMLVQRYLLRHSSAWACLQTEW